MDSSNPVKPEDYNGPGAFVHHHCHSVFSVLDGVGSPEQYARRCDEWDSPAMSITEHGNMASLPDIYFAFKGVKKKAIAGCEIYFNEFEKDRKNLPAIKELKATDPELQQRVSRNRHLTVLAKNDIGVENLIKLSTQAYETGYYYRPRIWFDKLCEYKEGLIILSGCLNGPVCHELRLEQPRLTSKGSERLGPGAVDWVRKFKEVFGDDYYIETQMPGIENDYRVFWQLIDIANFFKIKLVLTNDVHYLTRQEFHTQKLMMAIDQGTTVNDPELFHVNSDEQFFKSRADLWATFKNGRYSEKIDDRTFEEMCDNTLLIAEKCTGYKPDTGPKYPQLHNADQILTDEVMKSLRDRGLYNNPKRYLIDGKEVTYLEQAQIELDRFVSKGFASIFLITQDLIKHGKSKGWPFMPRGSAGGSLVVFLLGISYIDPLQWGLSSNRFMAESRGGFMLNVKMPPPKYRTQPVELVGR